MFATKQLISVAPSDVAFSTHAVLASATALQLFFYEVPDLITQLRLHGTDPLYSQ